MVVLATSACQLRSRLFACSGESRGFCVYCGRSFCDRHGVVLDDGHEVCSRKECVAKREDLARHLVYRVGVFERNRTGDCGISGCASKLGGQCRRCDGYFCAIHVFEREDTILRNTVRLRIMAALCHHCQARRPIWVRV